MGTQVDLTGKEGISTTKPRLRTFGLGSALMRKLAKWSVVLVVVAITGAFVWYSSAPSFPAPLLLPMPAPSGNTNFAVFPGRYGVSFVMPDGALWQWGKGATNTQGQPIQVDSGHQWTKIFTPAEMPWMWLGVDTNGNLWESGTSMRGRISAFGAKHDWIDVTGGAAYGLGLQRDGRAWGWDYQHTVMTPDGPRFREVPTFVPAATNSLWRAISANGPYCLGISTNGELWSWFGQGFSPGNFSKPEQESGNTKWAGVADGLYAWTDSGGLWGAPVDRLYSSSAVARRFALGPVVHEIRPDGTLWAIGEPDLPKNPGRRAPTSGAAFRISNGVPAPVRGANTSAGKKYEWHRLGKRSDWVSVWASNQVYVGLTADGTVWVWGIDWGHEPGEPLQSKLNRWWDSLCSYFKPKAAGTGTVVSRMFLVQPYIDEPRPLMRFKSTNE
jgi:hypothetical protein